MQLICEGHSQIQRMSQGMQIVLNHPTVIDKPVLQGDSDADANGASIYGSVIRDGGIFRMWYQAWPRAWDGGDVITVGCVESDDGLNWRRPNYGLVECLGTKANPLTDLPFHSPSVIIDPDADPGHRYRAFGYTAPEKFKGRFPRQVNAKGYFTAHSADGMHWDLDSPDPLWPGGDVITSVWDPVSRCARIALKTGRIMGGMDRRAFYTAEWRQEKASEPVSALFPDDYDDITARARGFNSADYYGVGLMPTKGPTIGFLWNFRHQLPLGHDESIGHYGRTGGVDISIVCQLERGGCWRHVSGRPSWLSTREAPEWARGAIYTAAYPLEVGDETWLYFCGSADRHGWCGDRVDYAEWYKSASIRQGLEKIGLAKWIRNRIIGCQADLIERIWLSARKADSSRLALNAVTQPGGRIRVQLMDKAGGNPVMGYGYDDCDPMPGNLRDVPVRWRGKDTLPSTPAIAEVEITRGTLYAFEYTTE